MNKEEVHHGRKQALTDMELLLRQLQQNKGHEK